MQVVEFTAIEPVSHFLSNWQILASLELVEISGKETLVPWVGIGCNERTTAHES